MVSPLIPILSLVIAALAVFFGPLITLRMNRKQLEQARRIADDQIELSRRIASKQIIAPMRQAWINSLRDKVAELSGSALQHWNTGFDEATGEEQRRLWHLQEEIKLLINPAERDHEELVDAIDRMLSALQRGVELEAARDFATARQKTILLGQTIFKTEWDRIKGDIERP